MSTRYLTPLVKTMEANLLQTIQLQSSAAQSPLKGESITNCPAMTCFQESQGDPSRSVNLNLAWNDTSGLDVNQFTVKIKIDGTPYTLTNSAISQFVCSISELPASVYSMNCPLIDAPNGASCGCPTMTTEIVSISDGNGNNLTSNESCTFSPAQGQCNP